MKPSLLVAGFFVLVVACQESDPAPSEENLPAGEYVETGGQLRGYSAINHDLNQRVFSSESKQPFYLAELVSERDDGELSGLDVLLGAFVGERGERVLRNHKPNAANILLYRIAFKTLADSIARNCLDPDALALSGQQFGLAYLKKSTIEIRPEFLEILAGLCRMNESPRLRRQEFRALWNTILGRWVPEEEFIPFYQVFGSEVEGDELERVSTTLQAIFLNPYFMIK